MGPEEKRNYTIIIVGATILGFIEFFVFPDPPPFWWSLILLICALLLILLLLQTIKLKETKKSRRKKKPKSKGNTDRTKLYLNLAIVVFLIVAAYLIYNGLVGYGGLFSFYAGIICIGIGAIISVYIRIKYDS